MKFKVLALLFVLSTSFSQETADFDFSENEENIGSWDIKNGVLIANGQGKTTLAEKNWNAFYSIFPKRITQKYIKRLVLITDGIDEKTGALGSLTTNNDKWQLVLDPVDVNFSSKSRERRYQSVYTAIHEFGHLLTLNNTQIIPTKKKTQSPNDPYINYEGQALKNSYINLFVEEFWNNGLLDEWDFIQKKYCFLEQDSKLCLDKLYGLYNENYTDFITDYAAESPEEDIVESWTAFVLKGKIDEPKSIAEKKINFFYQFPELVKYRKVIRKNAMKYLK